MNQRIVILIVAALLLTGGVLGLRSCLAGGELSEEEKLLALIDRMARLAEKREIKQMRRHLSRAYKDAEERGYAEINALLTYHYLRGGGISVLVTDKTVKVDRTAEPLQAKMTVKVVLARGPKGAKSLADLADAGARALSFRLKLKKDGDDGQWMLHAATWEGVEDLKELL